MTASESLRPLAGVKVVELTGQGPGPFAGMVLADLGAEVLEIDRPGGSWPRDVPGSDVMARGRARVHVDLKSDAGAAFVRSAARVADVFIDPFRPGVAERLGVGPDACCAENPRLVYVRVTGWGTEGPHAQVAGHDINYLAVAGALHCIGPSDGPPSIPLNLIGDYGGGGMLAVVGTLSALLERERSGIGQVVDVAIVDGIAMLMAELLGLEAEGIWTWSRQANILDGGAPYYNVYRTSDDRWVAVGAVEQKFYERLLVTLGLDPDEWPQLDAARGEQLAVRLREIFGGETLKYWIQAFEGVEACVSPVLTPEEAADHPQMKARAVYDRVDGVRQPRPAPRFGRSQVDGPATARSSAELLDRWGVTCPEMVWTAPEPAGRRSADPGRSTLRGRPAPRLYGGGSA